MTQLTPYDSLDDDVLWGHVRPAASRRLLVSALDCFARRGYHATTTRQIALQAGMSAGAVYVHYASKGELLYQISVVGHTSALAAVELAILPEVEDPVLRIKAIVRSFASWHAYHHRLAKVIQYELDSLPPDHSTEIKRLRHRFQERLERELTAGVKAGLFASPDVEGTALAILSLCIDIARWYSSTATRTPTELGELYADFVIRAICKATPATLESPPRLPCAAATRLAVTSAERPRERK